MSRPVVILFGIDPMSGFGDRNARFLYGFLLVHIALLEPSLWRNHNGYLSKKFRFCPVQNHCLELAPPKKEAEHIRLMDPIFTNLVNPALTSEFGSDPYF